MGIFNLIDGVWGAKGRVGVVGEKCTSILQHILIILSFRVRPQISGKLYASHQARLMTTLEWGIISSLSPGSSSVIVRVTWD